MKNPTLYIDRQKLMHNVRSMLKLADQNQVQIHFVTKVFCALRPMVEAMTEAGATLLADSRLENIVNYGELGTNHLLVRIPMISEAADVVRIADMSLNSDLDTLGALSDAATALGKRHGVVLMVELGDLREGFMPEELIEAAAQVLNLRGLDLMGIGANFNCYGGVIPDEPKLTELADLTKEIERRFNIELPIVSGGNSGSVYLMEAGRLPDGINHLRLGESWILGCETSYHNRVADLYTDVFTLEAEVIECRRKPSLPYGLQGPNAFGEYPVYEDRGVIRRAILAIGRQDLPCESLTPRLSGIEYLGSSSDHMILDVSSSVKEIKVGDTLPFGVDYGSLLAAMTSPYVRKVIV